MRQVMVAKKELEMCFTALVIPAKLSIIEWHSPKDIEDTVIREFQKYSKFDLCRLTLENVLMSLLYF